MNPIFYTAIVASALSGGGDDYASPHSRPADPGPFTQTRPRRQPRRSQVPPMPSASPLIAEKMPRLSEWSGDAEVFAPLFSR